MFTPEQPPRPEIPTVEASPARAGALLREVLREFGAVRFRVRGDCMRPGLAEGDEVLVVTAARRAPRFGDVVLLDWREGLRLHRLLWSGSGGPRTKGDRAPGFDARHLPEAALGTVAGVFRPEGLVAVRSRARAMASLLSGLVTRARRALSTSLVRVGRRGP